MFLHGAYVPPLHVEGPVVKDQGQLHEMLNHFAAITVSHVTYDPIYFQVQTLMFQKCGRYAFCASDCRLLAYSLQLIEK